MCIRGGGFESIRHNVAGALLQGMWLTLLLGSALVHAGALDDSNLRKVEALRHETMKACGLADQSHNLH